MKVRGLETGRSEDEGFVVNLLAIIVGRLRERVAARQLFWERASKKQEAHGSPLSDEATHGFDGKDLDIFEET